MKMDKNKFNYFNKNLKTFYNNYRKSKKKKKLLI